MEVLLCGLNPHPRNNSACLKHPYLRIIRRMERPECFVGEDKRMMNER
jgi:hypothetical protein